MYVLESDVTVVPRLVTEIVRCVSVNEKIKKIKAFRHAMFLATGEEPSLKESKDFIEKYFPTPGVDCS